MLFSPWPNFAYSLKMTSLKKRDLNLFCLQDKTFAVEFPLFLWAMLSREIHYFQARSRPSLQIHMLWNSSELTLAGLNLDPSH